MQFASKKITTPANRAQQHAQILSIVKKLLEKDLIRIEDNRVCLYPQIWKDALTAQNWMQCVYIYCCIKKHIKEKSPIFFEHFVSGELLGEIRNGKAKLYFNEFS